MPRLGKRKLREAKKILWGMTDAQIRRIARLGSLDFAYRVVRGDKLMYEKRAAEGLRSLPLDGGKFLGYFY